MTKIEKLPDVLDDLIPIHLLILRSQFQEAQSHIPS